MMMICQDRLRTNDRADRGKSRGGRFTQNVPREEIGFFGFSIRSASYRYTEVRQEYRFESMPFKINVAFVIEFPLFQLNMII